jgi:hypothetical protein
MISVSQPILSSIRSLSPSVRHSKSSRQHQDISSFDNQRRSESTCQYRQHSASIDSYYTNDMDTLPIGLHNNGLDFKHIDILVYTRPMDFHRVLLTLNIIDDLIRLLSNQLIYQLLTIDTIETSAIYEQCCQQQRIIHGNDTHDEQRSYLFVLIDQLVIYIRSYPLTSDNTQSIDNHEIHLRSYQLLACLCEQLSSLCIEQMISIVNVNSLLRKVALQKTILHIFHRILTDTSRQFIVVVDNPLLTVPLSLFTNEFLHLLETLIVLEYHLSSADADLFYQSLVNQTCFLSSILQCLMNTCFIEHHRSIVEFIHRILPFCGSALKTISCRTIEQIVRNLCFLVDCYRQPHESLKYK